MSGLAEIDDPCRPSNGTMRDFREILVIRIAAVLSDCDTVEDIAFWGRKKEAWLRRFLVLKNGVPSEETFLRILRVLDPKQFEAVFRRWVGGVAGALSGDAASNGTIAINGKTVRGSGSGGERAIHRVSAFATKLGRALGQEKVAAKSNELTAIPELLEALSIKGLLLTIDAIGCQKSIAKQIIAKKGDYLLMVKGNQPKLLAAIETVFIDQYRSEIVDRNRLVDRALGRTVGQIASVLPAKGIVDPAEWLKCATIGRIGALRVVGGKESELEQRYCISSRTLSAEELAAAVQARSRAGLDSASARQRSKVGAEMLKSRATDSSEALSGGNSRAIALSLKACPYLATSFFHYRPRVCDSNEATTILTQGGSQKVEDGHQDANAHGARRLGRRERRGTVKGTARPPIHHSATHSPSASAQHAQARINDPGLRCQ